RVSSSSASRNEPPEETARAEAPRPETRPSARCAEVLSGAPVLFDARGELGGADLLLLLDLVGIDHQRRDPLTLLELPLIQGGGVLRLEGADAHTMPQAPPRHVGGLAKRRMAPASQVFHEAIGVLLLLEARDLHQVPALHAGIRH